MNKKCLYCGKEFAPIRSNQVYCSTTCRCSYHKVRVMGKYHANRRAISNPLVKCPQCGREFEFTASHKVYCSTLCRSLYWGHGRVLLKCQCLECGKEFESTYNAKYCSKKCRARAKKRERATLNTVKATNKPSKSLADWCREADECGLDYGTYRGLMLSGESFEQLKSLKDSHSVPTHAHGTQARRLAMTSTFKTFL